MNKHSTPKKDALYSVSLKRETLGKLRALEERTQITLSNLALAVIDGLIRYEEQHGELRSPFQAVPCSELAALRAAAERRPRARQAVDAEAEAQRQLDFT